jgi:Holliday junction resolvase
VPTLSVTVYTKEIMARTRSQAGKHAKAKGSKAERDLAKKFQDWWGTGAVFARTPGSGGWGRHQTQFNAAGDITCSDATFPFTIESKNQEGWILDQLLTAPKNKLFDFWEQAVGETPAGKAPLLVIKRNRTEFLVVFNRHTVFELSKTNTVHSNSLQPNHLLPCLSFCENVISSKFCIMTLEQFLKVDPGFFGRKVPENV